MGTEKVSAPIWWDRPTASPTPTLIKVETDAGSFVAAASFSGEHVMGVRRAERPRQEGESRRRRRSVPADRSPLVQDAQGAMSTGREIEVVAREPEVPAVEPVALVPREVQATVDAVRTDACGSAALVEPAERPRVAAATRVRSRLAAHGDPGAPWVATTLATRLALTATTARKGDGG